MEIRGKHFIVNTRREDTAEFIKYCKCDGLTLYEVFRIIEKKPLFLEDHIRRFAHSASLAGVELPINQHEIKATVFELIRTNRFRNANIKLIACYPRDAQPYFCAYFVEHQYPTPAMFKNGVETVTLSAIRVNPNAKIFNTALRNETNEIKSRLKIYEVLLVDEKGNITEGSRSNFFAIRNGEVITPPLQDVLPGVTRMHVIEACGRLGYSVNETNISPGDAALCDAVFITGTSRKILPIRKIDELTFRVDNPVMRALMDEFTVIVRQYLQMQQ